MMVLNFRQTKVCLTTLIIISTMIYLIYPPLDTFTTFYYYLNPKESIKCFHDNDKETLPDISEIEPEPGRSIFFHETSCNSHFNGKIVITARQACAVESAARQNPNFNIYLLYASPGIFRFENTESDDFLKVLLSYFNVKILHLNYEKYTKNTPVEKLYKNNKIDKSGYAKSHASDILRYLTLWKYGGIYLDLDVIVLKNLDELGQNYAGSESERNVAAGILNFSPNGNGHQLARSCLEDLKHNFKGHDWGYNGPGVITRLLRQICSATEAKDMVNKNCEGFKVYSPEYFYPIPWWNWTMYFDRNHIEDVEKMTKKSYVIHVWNKHSIETKIPINNKVPYLLFAQKYCPNVFRKCRQFF